MGQVTRPSLALEGALATRTVCGATNSKDLLWESRNTEHHVHAHQEKQNDENQRSRIDPV
ncbi:unnamed protein product, partial [Amoebophrya sp. A25]|eukprot:GSA25T00026503001.1